MHRREHCILMGNTPPRIRPRKGHLAEWRARLWLRLRGWRILGHRVRTPLGEIDIIARRGRTIVFVEVKRRRTLQEALAALAPRQQRRIVRAAGLWLARHPGLAGHDLRFDLVAVDARLRLCHVPDAWRPDDAVDDGA